MIRITNDDIAAVLAILESTNRNGDPYNWPADHDLGKVERAVDEFIYQLYQTWPFRFAELCVNGLAKALSRF